METAMTAMQAKEGFWIGKADMFYTLWSCDTVGASYIQNISSASLEDAQRKLGDMGINIVGYDPELRGKRRIIFTTPVVNVNKTWTLPLDEMPWGKYVGTKISDMENTYSLILMLHDGRAPLRLRANVRRRLIELGSIVRFEGELMYADRRDEILQERMGGHHFTNGERVTLEIKQLQSFGYESMYGWVSIVIYQTECGKVVKYKGANPPYIADRDTEYAKVVATVKHSEYNGKNETQIQRVKVL